MTFSSRRYFGYLLALLSRDHLHASVSAAAKADAQTWMAELLAGFVTSADTGNEDLVIASRGALCDYCEKSPANLGRVCAALVRNLKAQQGRDRTLVPTLEVIAFLFYAGIFPRCAVDYANLCLLVQRAAYKTGNVRKLEACVKVYGAVAGSTTSSVTIGEAPETTKRDEGAREARRRLGALMLHPWPRIRSLVVDELWGLLSAGDDAQGADKLKGVDWSKADTAALKTLVRDLGLA